MQHQIEPPLAMDLARFDVALFLREHWQQKPLLIRKAFTHWTNPLDPDELAGLACEEGIEARLIRNRRRKWEAELGPFDETRFQRREKSPWTLLVQAVDHHVPEVAALIAPFRFIPNWRIDDVMVSYATDGGGVGPHFDQYDVFLVQGLGRRRWQLGAACDAATELLPHDHLSLLAHFEPTQEWLLEPGDVLYVPPRIAHNGVAVGDHCMTYSVGFRAPARSELVAHWCDHVLAETPDEDRYADPGLPPQANPGEIAPAALAALHAMVAETLLDPQAFARWFGTYNSTRKYADVEWQPEAPVDVAQMRAGLAADAPLQRNPASRFSFIRQDADTILLFVDGECHECTGETARFAQALCATDTMPASAALLRCDAAMALIATLINQGSVAFIPQD